jgi:hypothetical protein
VGSGGIGAAAAGFARRFADLRVRLAGGDLRGAFLAFLALRFAGARRDAATRFFAALRFAFFAGAFFFALRAMRISLEWA